MTYCKLKTGEVVVLWSNNPKDKTINAYPVSKINTFDVEVDICREYTYSEVVDLNYVPVVVC